jgi:hypothetical protein
VGSHAKRRVITQFPIARGKVAAVIVGRVLYGRYDPFFGKLS